MPVAPSVSQDDSAERTGSDSINLQGAVDRAANALASANDVALKIRVRNTVDTASAFAVRDDDTILMSPTIAAQAQDRMEYLALAAVIAGYFTTRIAPLQIGRPVDPTKVAAALAVAVVGSQLDKVDPGETDPALRSRQNLQWQSEPVKALPVDRVATARALVMLTKAGGCSAPLVTVLKRIAGRGNADVSEAARQFARRVIASLGAAIYPPDRFCLSR